MTQLPDTSTEAGQRQASVMLARMMGWHIGNKETTERGAWIRVLCDDKGNDLGLRPPFGGGIAPKRQELVPNSFFNLYRHANMALAWRVICWLVDPKNDPFFVWFKEEDRPRFYAGLQWRSWWSANSHDYYNDTAQRAWLDNALIFAINAGMLEAQP